MLQPMLPPTLTDAATWALTQERVLMWMLALSRVSGLLGAMPGFGAERIPNQYRVVLGVSIATLMTPTLLLPVNAKSWGLPDMVFALAGELAVGLLLGTMVAWILEAVAFAGNLMDTQMGFSFVQIVDPINANPTSVAGSLMGQVALLLFFTSGLHHVAIQALHDSWRVVPPGRLPTIDAMGIVAFLGQLLARGFMLAFPVLALLFLVDLAMGFAGKFMPQLQLLQLSFPLKISLGLLLLGFMLRELSAWLRPLMEQLSRLLPRLISG
ncbi:MAG TPA: flagellar biosynthetic protein FliR [Holophagaceae bacterium]|nr:flagellar biosynthetic protein FliR [Holophagaceae bacterium]